jgi:halocyanin-like protein
VSSGTTVTWEWTGEGGAHNVVHEDGDFDSGSAVDSDSETYEYTFDSTGTYEYYCSPHETVGMKGVVVVE